MSSAETLAQSQNAAIFGEVIVDPTIVRMIEAARAGIDFATMRREYGLPAQGTLGTLEAPTNVSDGAGPVPEAPQA